MGKQSLPVRVILASKITGKLRLPMAPIFDSTDLADSALG